MPDYVAYDNTTGRINYAGFVTDSADVALQGTYTMLGVGYPTTDYIYAGNITTRPLFSSVITITNAGGWTADNTDIYQITGIPNPTTIKIVSDNRLFEYAGAQTITDGTLQLKTKYAGVYTIYMYSFPFQDVELSVTAV